ARLVALAEEEVRVELDHVDLDPELGDHVDEHRRLLLPGAGQAEPVAEAVVGPADHVLRGQGLDVRKLQARRRHYELSPVARRGLTWEPWAPPCNKTSFSVSPRSPRRSVSSGITSSGGMFPRFTPGPNWRTNQACELFVGASKTRSST